jgi:DNA-directed RNA polymerase specialized sigma24 family protein
MQDSEIKQPVEVESSKPERPRHEGKPRHFQKRNPRHAPVMSSENDENVEVIEVEPLTVTPLDPANPVPARHLQPWTPSERKQVSNAYNDGLSIEQIAIACGRSELAVASHLNYAGLLGRSEAFSYAKKTN